MMINGAYLLLMIGALMVLAGGFCMIRTFHMLKITIGIEVAVKGVTLFLVLAGNVAGKVALSESFIITIIVLEVVVAVVGTGTAVGLFRKYGSMDVRNLSRLKG